MPQDPRAQASGLEDLFQEAATEFVHTIMDMSPGLSGGDYKEAQPEIDKFVTKLLDAVSTTTMFDPH